MSSAYPSSGGSHPVGKPARKKPWWLLLLLAVVAIIVLLILLATCGGDDSSDAPPPVPAATTSTDQPTSDASTTDAPTATSTAPTSSSASASTSTGSASTAGSGSGGGSTSDGSGRLTADGTSLLPLSESAQDGSLGSYTGQKVKGRAVTVQSVPADEGFWVGTSESDRVWVQLVGDGESPYQVKQGDAVDLKGKMVRTGKGFAERVGVDDGEGAALLTSQKSHIQVRTGTVTLSQA